MTESQIRRVFAHMAWADARVLEAIRRAPGDAASARRLFAHVLAVERLWYARIQGDETSGLEIWPDLSIEECEGLANLNAANYKSMLARLLESEFGVSIDYTNIQGRRFETSIVDILTQVASHGTYHRGQIASELRRAGAEPAVTDFIVYVRETP